ncbi:GNAT family N-acetyltransferase [Mycetocola zhujimingii]|uniref:GNAT family N-acetyltransferase n=1 Tax=Mycetocola zhujimingii TaxID=2079792 RepID=UPI000D3A2E5C|nr:GNAT family N-acetyltransferase [Mycetocola zhujimingii]AWB85554.1 GNAT family N-acetyltransferase [Mycetocola zhujimingii]
MTLTVRRAQPTDAAGLGELAAATFPLACPPGSAPEAIAEYIAGNLTAQSFDRYLDDSNRVILLAEDAGELIGYMMLIGGEPTDADVAAAVMIRPTIELSKAYALPGAHGRGVAVALMAATLDAARERGAAGIWLGVNQLNARALRFYEKSGFAIVGEKKFSLGPEVHNDFVMERTLAGQS